MMAWKPEVLVGGKWGQNGLVFATEAEAKNSAHDLFMRWTTCEDHRAVEVPGPATHSYHGGVLKHLSE
jgi:hypothetical protein